MTPVEREREQIRRQFEDAYYRCRRDPMEGLSFTEEDMMAAIQRSLNVFRATDELPSQEAATQVAEVATPERKEYDEDGEEVVGNVVDDAVGVFNVGETVCSSLSFLVCTYLYGGVEKKNTSISLQFVLNALLQLYY
jgi:hypothetical protein